MRGRSIPVDITDTPDEYLIEASLPGVTPEHVHISAADNTVTIRVGRRAPRTMTAMSPTCGVSESSGRSP